MFISAKQRFFKSAFTCACASIVLAACGGGGTDDTENATADLSGSGAFAESTQLATTYYSWNSTTGWTSGTTGTTAAPAPTTTTTTTSTALPADKTCGLVNFQQDLMNLINQARASSRYCGSTFYPAAAPLAWNSKLFNAAAGHSVDMATRNYFSHTSLDGRSFSKRITDAGYLWRTAGENIAAGQTTVQQVMNSWLQSPGHCANIMKSSFKDIGVACAKNANSTYKQYWTMDLAAPQ